MIASMPAALDQLAETLRQADGLPELSEFWITFDAHGEPLVIAETLDAYSWANHLHLYPLPNTATGEVQFRGRANGLTWSFLYIPGRADQVDPSDWDGLVHRTQAFQAVSSR